MRTTSLAILTGVVVLVLATTAQADPIADAAADFSSSSNPNGVWSYGSTSSLGGSLTLFTVTGGFVGNANNFGWFGLAPGHFSGEPVIVKNISGSIQDSGGMRLDPGQIGVHPGPSGEFAVIRWTATIGGDYSIAAAFESRDRFSGATTDVHVLLNNSAIFNGAISGGFGPGSGPSFATLLTLSAGDTIDFAVGFGNGSFFNDSTGLAATVTGPPSRAPVPEPGTLILMASALAGIAWRSRLRARCARE